MNLFVTVSLYVTLCLGENPQRKTIQAKIYKSSYRPSQNEEIGKLLWSQLS